MSTLSSQQTLF